jgi:hypothetical protein
MSTAKPPSVKATATYYGKGLPAAVYVANFTFPTPVTGVSEINVQLAGMRPLPVAPNSSFLSLNALLPPKSAIKLFRPKHLPSPIPPMSANSYR